MNERHTRSDGDRTPTGSRDRTAGDPHPADTPRVGVVGAGITGLALAHYLTEAGADVRAFEADTRPGGVLRTRRVDGRVLECGPQRLRLSPPVRELVEAAGVGDELVRADGDPPLWIYRDGALRRAPLSPRTALSTDLLSWRGKLRVLAEPLSAPPRPGESVHEALGRTFGPEARDYLLAPLYAGLYAADAREMPVEHSLGRALENHGVGRSILLKAVRAVLRGRSTPPVVSFERGLSRLPEGLYDRHSDRVDLSTPVERIRRPDGGTHTDGGTPGTGGGWILETPEGEDRFDRVVLTTPADATADLIADLDPDSAAALRSVRYNPVAAVFLRSEYRAEGLGYLVPDPEDLRTDGVTFNAALFDRDGVFTATMGGADDPAAVGETDATLSATAAREFEAVTGVPAEPLGVHRWHRGIPAHDRSFDALERVDLPDDLHLATNYTARAGIPGRIRQAKRVAGRIAGE